MRILHILLFSGVCASFAYAAPGKNDPKGEPRKDPKEQREAVEHVQNDLRSLKLEQTLLRWQARGMSRAEALAKLKARLAKQSGEIQAQWNVLYDPRAELSYRVSAMKDKSVPNTTDNWKSWLYIAKHDSDSVVKTLAWRRAAEASPAYRVTKDSSELVQVLLADVDMSTMAGYRRLVDATGGKYEFADRAVVEALTDQDKTELAQAAKSLLDSLLLPKPATQTEKAWLKLLSYWREVDVEAYVPFDAVDFADTQKAEIQLEAMLQAQRQQKDINRQAYDDRAGLEASGLARIVLESVVRPVAPGSLRAVVLRRMSEMRIDFVARPSFEDFWTLEDLKALHKRAAGELANWNEHGNVGMVMKGLIGDLALRMRDDRPGVELDRVSEEDLAKANETADPEYGARVFARIGYDPNAKWESRLAAVQENEVAVEDFNGEGYRLWLGIAFSDSNMFVRTFARQKVHAAESRIIGLWVKQFFDSRPTAFTAERAESLWSRLSNPSTEKGRQIYKDFRDPAVSKELSDFAASLRHQSDAREFGTELKLMLQHYRPYRN